MTILFYVLARPLTSDLLKTIPLQQKSASKSVLVCRLLKKYRLAVEQDPNTERWYSGKELVQLFADRKNKKKKCSMGAARILHLFDKTSYRLCDHEKGILFHVFSEIENRDLYRLQLL